MRRVAVRLKTRVERILVEEEESVDWHEAQLHLVEDIGRERYLAEMIHE